MARLYEHQSKDLLRQGGVAVPEGGVAFSPEEARAVAARLGRPAVVKIQAWVTGRAALGGIKFVDNPAEAEAEARRLLGMKVGGYVVDRVLVEERLDVASEYFAGLVIDDALKAPVLVFASAGGSGIEEIAARNPERVVRAPIDVAAGLREFEARNLVRRAGVKGPAQAQLAELLVRLYQVARAHEARSAEVNPIILTRGGRVYAADCHLIVDDYAVFRHPELGIEVAREFDRPPTELERIAYKVEEKDYRGTFYFLQLMTGEADATPGTGDPIGFHGAGGGGSMMSMDAVLRRGFRLANYCDTSGNPPAGKVYRAAKIILSQPGIKGYFASGSGVASQEQFHSARGLVKAFWEERLEIPAVIRLGGNCEEEAISILAEHLGGLPGKVEGYGRDDAPEACAARLAELIAASGGVAHSVRPLEDPPPPPGAYLFETLTGSLSIDHRLCPRCPSKGCVPACAAGVLALVEGVPVLAIPPADAKKGKCTECLACEIFCKFHERDAIRVRLPIPGLKEYRDKVRG